MSTISSNGHAGRSVNLTTLFLDMFGPPKQLCTMCLYFRQLLTTALLELPKGGK